MTNTPDTLSTPIRPEAGRSPFRLDRRPSLARSAAERLIEAIEDGTLKQGQHLVETEMARKLGISRGPLREAFKILAADGLVEILQDRGAFVATHSPEDIEQMIVVRAMTEGMAARLFVTRALPEQRDRVRAILRAMASAGGESRSRDWRELDWQFHEAVLLGSGNRFLMQSWRTLGRLLRVYVMHVNPLYDLHAERFLKTHQMLGDAVLADDPGAAEALFRQTILSTGFFVLGRGIPSEFATEVAPGEPSS
ncbi:MAG: GntR family transcriptional regulator [Azospirillaceae bacterium]